VSPHGTGEAILRGDPLVALEEIPPQTLRNYADTWLPERTAVRGLKPKTVSEYQRYLDR